MPGGGREAFLPVEHMLPRTEASTNAVRATVPWLVATVDGYIRVVAPADDLRKTYANIYHECKYH